MEPGRGLVLEVNKRSCIVITGDGRFLEIPKPRGAVEVGREITFSRTSPLRFKGAYWAVASILVVVVLAWWVFYAMLPQTVAYVALDINPSLELAINADSEIISTRGVNEDGDKLLQRVNVLHEPLDKGVQKIISGCIEYQYLTTDKDNLVLATVTDAKKGKPPVGKQKNQELKQVSACVYTTIDNTINESGVDAELIIADTDLATLKKAHATGVTPGRYLLQKEAQKNGVEITDQELREERIRELEAKKNFRAGDLIQQHKSTDLSGLSGQKLKKDNFNSLGSSGKSHENQLYVRLGRSERSEYLAMTNWSGNNEFYTRGKLYVPRDNGYLTGIKDYSQFNYFTNDNKDAKNKIDYNNQGNKRKLQEVSWSSSYSWNKAGDQQNRQLQKASRANQSGDRNNWTRVTERGTGVSVNSTEEKNKVTQGNKQSLNPGDFKQSTDKNNWTTVTDRGTGVSVNSREEKNKVTQDNKQSLNPGGSKQSGDKNNWIRVTEYQTGVSVNSREEKNKVTQGNKQSLNPVEFKQGVDKNNWTRVTEHQTGVSANSRDDEKSKVTQGNNQSPSPGGFKQSGDRNNWTRVTEREPASASTALRGK